MRSGAGSWGALKSSPRMDSEGQSCVAGRHNGFEHSPICRSSLAVQLQTIFVFFLSLSLLSIASVFFWWDNIRRNSSKAETFSLEPAFRPKIRGGGGGQLKRC